MRKTIIIETDEVAISVTSNDSETAMAIWEAAPFSATARTWGDEVYFDTPLQLTPEPGAKEVLDFGEIAYWVAGNCIAIGFGPTPVSQGDEIRLASKANIWGHSDDDLTIMNRVRDGDPIHVRRG